MVSDGDLIEIKLTLIETSHALSPMSEVLEPG